MREPNYVEETSEFTTGMTWLEETQLSNQAPQGCLKRRGVVAFCARVMETVHIIIQCLFAGNDRPAGKFVRGKRALYQPLPPSIFLDKGIQAAFFHPLTEESIIPKDRSFWRLH